MLTKDRESLEKTHAVGASVSIGNRTATLVEHYHDWEQARVTAFYVATQRRQRCVIVWCETHKQWMVWRTNRSCRVKSLEEALICKQCGERYSFRACGPTHALQWHRLQLTGVKP